MILVFFLFLCKSKSFSFKKITSFQSSDSSKKRVCDTQTKNLNNKLNENCKKNTEAKRGLSLITSVLSLCGAVVIMVIIIVISACCNKSGVQNDNGIMYDPKF